MIVALIGNGIVHGKEHMSVIVIIADISNQIRRMNLMNIDMKTIFKNAEAGNVDAMLVLADAYNSGKYNLEKDDSSSFVYYKKAADTGHSMGEFHVALRYQDGTGTKKNTKLAIEYMRSSAEKGFANAQYFMGLYYKDNIIKGFGREKKAFKYFLKAAEQGVADAQEILGDIYFLGEGVAKDLDNSVFWLSCAFLQGKEGAQRRLEHLIEQNIPGGRPYIVDMIEDVKKNYKHYINK